MKFIFEWKKYFTSECSEGVKSFFHEKINFICSSQCVIFFLLHIRYECFENYTHFAMSQTNWWRYGKYIYHSYPGCSFIWNLRVVYFTVKHSYLCNKLICDICFSQSQTFILRSKESTLYSMGFLAHTVKPQLSSIIADTHGNQSFYTKGVLKISLLEIYIYNIKVEIQGFH